MGGGKSERLQVVGGEEGGEEEGGEKGGEDGAKVLRRLNSWRGGVALIRSQFSDSWIWSEVSLRTYKGPEVDLALKKSFPFLLPNYTHFLNNVTFL